MVRSGNILDYHGRNLSAVRKYLWRKFICGVSSICPFSSVEMGKHSPTKKLSPCRDVRALRNSARLAQLPSAANAALALAPDQTEKKVKL